MNLSTSHSREEENNGTAMGEDSFDSQQCLTHVYYKKTENIEDARCMVSVEHRTEEKTVYSLKQFLGKVGLPMDKSDSEAR